MCKVYTGNHGTSEIEHGLCACMVNNPLASLRTGTQTMLYLSESSERNSVDAHEPNVFFFFLFFFFFVFF